MITPSIVLDALRSNNRSTGCDMQKLSGGCCCGRVKFEVETAAEIEALQCNCSICVKSGFLHLIVPKSRFILLRGFEYLAKYTFNTGIAQHLFCKICGVKSFYIPRSNPDGYSVNLRCLEAQAIAGVTVRPFDGRNWEENAGPLASLSKRAHHLKRR